MIYAIRALGTPFVKIGFTAEDDAEERAKCLQTGCPYDLKVVASGPGERELERRYHWLLKRAGAHERGEWFRVGPETERVIWRIRESASPKVIPQQAVAGQIPIFAKTHTRLGRVLQYAKFASDAANSPSKAAGTPEALQPHKGAASA